MFIPEAPHKANKTQTRFSESVSHFVNSHQLEARIQTTNKSNKSRDHSTEHIDFNSLIGDLEREQFNPSKGVTIKTKKPGMPYKVDDYDAI